MYTWLKTTLVYLGINLVINSGATRELVVAKRLVVNNFGYSCKWWFGYGSWGSCEYRGLIESSLYTPLVL